MTHPAHYMDYVRGQNPETITDTVNIIASDPNSPLALINTRNDPQAKEEVAQFASLLRKNQGGGATALGDGRGWEIQAEDGWFILRGALYPGGQPWNKRTDTSSPMLLIDRSGVLHKAYYGPDVVDLALIALENALAYDALTRAREGHAPLAREDDDTGQSSANEPTEFDGDSLQRVSSSPVRARMLIVGIVVVVMLLLFCLVLAR